MEFDIHQLDNVELEGEEANELLKRYQDTLVEQFYNSPEGQQRLQNDPDMSFWAGQLIHFGFTYIGVSLPTMKIDHIDEIVTDIFPRKITIQSPDDADDTIPELISFWQFLKREYQLPNAELIIKYLNSIAPDYKSIMNDNSKYGMAKSFIMAGKSAGFDMTNEVDFYKFALLYNNSISPPDTTPLMKNLFPSSKQNEQTDKNSDKNKKRKLRQIAKATRKKNRKRK